MERWWRKKSKGVSEWSRGTGVCSYQSDLFSVVEQCLFLDNMSKQEQMKREKRRIEPIAPELGYEIISDFYM